MHLWHNLLCPALVIEVIIEAWNESRKALKIFIPLCIFIVACSPKQSWEPHGEIDGIRYITLHEDNYDSGVKAQINLDLLISGQINKINLKQFLEEAARLNSKRAIFKNSEYPTHIAISAYTSREKIQETLGWAGYLFWRQGVIKEIKIRPQNYETGVWVDLSLPQPL